MTPAMLESCLFEFADSSCFSKTEEPSFVNIESLAPILPPRAWNYEAPDAANGSRTSNMTRDAEV